MKYSRGLICLALLAGGLAGRSATFNANFDGGIPPGVNLFGSSLNYDHSTGGVNNSGVLKLTDATGSQQGGAIIDDFDGGATIGGFDVTFDLYIGSGNGADGMSFFFGDFADGAHSEEGPGSIEGLTISFDVYNNGGTPAEAPAIDLKWNNNILIHRLVGAASTTTGAQPIGSATTIRSQTTTGGAAVYWPVKIHVDTDGTLDLVYNGTVVYTNIPIFRPITEFTRGPAARFGFAARTGGSYDNHFVDNLKITTVPLDAASGQPNLVACLPLALANQNAGAPASPVAGVVIDLRDGTASVATGSVKMTYNGASVTPSLTKVGDISRIAFNRPEGYLAGGVNTIVVTYTTTSTPAFTNSFTYTALVGTASAISPVYALPSADTAKPGFKAKVYQIDINRNPATGQFLNAERQIAGGYIDPSTGQPYPNTADLSAAEPDGYFIEPTVINWDETGPGTAGGNFADNAAVPGIPGGNGTDRYVFSIETILELKAGGYRFGVSSDDGFRLSIGRGPGDVAGVQLGTAGDRGYTDSLMDVVVPVDGFYPFRLMWFETGGGSGCEFFFVDSTGTKRLVNDLNAPMPIKAYRESSATPPYVSRALPTVGYLWSFADQDLVIDVTDGAAPMDAGSAVLTLNGAAQTLTATKSGKVTTLTRKSSLSNLLPSGTIDTVLVYSYSNSGTATMVTNSWTFRVPAYTRPIPVANKVQAGQVTGTGFHVRPHQLDRSKDNNQGNGGRYSGNNGSGNNMPRAEMQLTDGYLQLANGLPYPNLRTAGPNPDGSYEVPDVLNWNNGQSTGGPAANAGIFNNDTQTPGLPGTGTSNFGLDNYAAEITTYLDLKAGVYVFGINVDDGWVAYSSPNVRDTLGTLLGYRNAPGGQNGNPLNNPNAAFTVIVTEDGIYPFRILFWQGGGGVNMEFMSVDRNTGTQLLVNDTGGVYPSVVGNSGASISPIQAYNTYNGPTRPWTKFSVYPPPTMGTLYQFIHQQSGPGPITLAVAGGNPADIANDEPRADQALVNRPFGDAVGAIVAELGGASVGMVLDGAAVTPTVTPIAGTTDNLVLYTPNPPLAPGSTHTAGLVYAGATNYWTFTVITYTNVPAGIAMPVSKADPTAIGFRAKIVQAAAARAGGNTVAAAEAQLVGTPASVALPGPEADGTYIVPGILNWNVTKNPGATLAEIGNFQTARGNLPDAEVPGIPGTGLTGNPRFENIAAEITAFLELPAGYQKFGINGDDGWAISVATAGVTNGTVLFSRDRGAGARDIPFAFITPEAGLYPIRLVWYQGGGGGNLELFTYGANNEKIPVNARSNPNAIKAYYKAEVAQPPPNFTKITVQGGNVTIEWTGGGTLQSAPAVDGPWTDVAGATSPLTIPASEKMQFGRIKR